MFRVSLLKTSASILVLTLGLGGCSASQPPAPAIARTAPVAAPAFVIPRIELPREVMLGIDVLEAEGFAPLRGKRLALLTHPAGVDRRGLSTVEVLRRAPGLRLVALFATEHGIHDEHPAGRPYPDEVDPRTGLMVYSLYNGRTHKPTPAQLKGIDALVIDLQDIGVRSYTFAGAMRKAMEGCFENNVEVIVLDRPNPLGGLKVDGPMLDPQYMDPAAPAALVNEFPVPYVHGLTIGELARLTVGTPGLMPEAVRRRGRLVVIPMKNWRRGLRWPETGLAWIPTSPLITDFASVEGYAMTGLGSEKGFGDFRSGAGSQYAFRGVFNQAVKIDIVERELRALHPPGLRFDPVSVPNARTGKPGTILYAYITDWDEWRPTELNFQLMRLTCKLEQKNPFAAASSAERQRFLRLMGSGAFYQDIAAHGARVDVEAYLREWQARDRIFQQQSRRFWLYP